MASLSPAPGLAPAYLQDVHAEPNGVLTAQGETWAALLPPHATRWLVNVAAAICRPKRKAIEVRMTSDFFRLDNPRHLTAVRNPTPTRHGS